MTKISSLGVYCGSRMGDDDAYGDAASRLGGLMAERGIRLVYGGGGIGIMGLLADAVLAGGGQVTGIIPGHLKQAEVGHAAVQEMVVVDSMHERKSRMFEAADGIVILPGGLGTLDEAFEMITWKQLGLHEKPIVLADIEGYWQPLLRLIDAGIADGYVAAESRGLFAVAEDVDGIFAALEAASEPRHAAQAGRL